jgi:hypothetical protein
MRGGGAVGLEGAVCDTGLAATGDCGPAGIRPGTTDIGGAGGRGVAGGTEGGAGATTREG